MTPQAYPEKSLRMIFTEGKKSLMFVGLFLILGLSVFVSAEEEVLINSDITRAYGDTEEVAWKFVSSIERSCERDSNKFRADDCKGFYAEYTYAKDPSVLAIVQIEESFSETDNADFILMLEQSKEGQQFEYFRESTFSSFKDDTENNLYIYKTKIKHTNYNGKSYTCVDGTNIIVRDSGTLTSETIDIGDKYDEYCVNNNPRNGFVWYSDKKTIFIDSYADTPSEHLVLAYLEKYFSDLVFCSEGCKLNDKCVSIGYRKSGEYCSLDNKFVSQLEENIQCDNNFECGSNVCVDNQCLSGNLIQKILNWFKNLFG